MTKKKEEKQTKEQEYLEGWKRALADYENLQKDMSGRLDESRKRIKSDLAHELLPVMDNFDQAVAHAPELEEHKSWLDGVLFIKKQFEDVVASLGLEKIAVGETFDPNLHEAVGEAEAMEEVKSGWKIGEQVIRPAQVLTKKEN